jgi:predicted ArsR family transcriptional regulator
LRALRACYRDHIPVETLKKQATAFTHPRRIEIMRLISKSSISTDALAEITGISFAALNRHLNKLKARGFVRGKNNVYRNQTPADAFSKTLLKIVNSEKTG